MIDLTTQRTTLISFAVFSSIVAKFATSFVQVPGTNISIPTDYANWSLLMFLIVYSLSYFSRWLIVIQPVSHEDIEKHNKKIKEIKQTLEDYNLVANDEDGQELRQFRSHFKSLHDTAYQYYHEALDLTINRIKKEQIRQWFFDFAFPLFVVGYAVYFLISNL